MNVEIFAQEVYHFTLWGTSFSVRNTDLSGILLTAFILLLAVLFRFVFLRRFKVDIRRAGRFQLFFEYMIEKLDKFTTDTLGHLGTSLSPYILTVGAYILLSSVLELIGLRSPLTDLSCTIVFGFFTFLLINYYGIKQLGILGRIGSYFKPKWFMAPFKLITDLSAPVSLSCRLFGNMLGGYIIMELVYQAIMGLVTRYQALWVSAVLPSFLSMYFVLFHVALQFYIFSMLSVNFIKEAVED